MKRHFALSLTVLTALSAGVAHAQSLRMATPLFVPEFGNPYQALTLPQIVSTLASFDPMVVIDKSGKVQPWLAESWSTKDSKVWTLTLRDGVKFANGVPFTSEAVVASVEHMKTDKGRIETVGSSLAIIDRAVATSPRTVELHLKRADALFVPRMALWKIPEPASWKKQMAAGDAPRGVGTGPYVMTESTTARLVHKPNPEAWNAPKTPQLEIIQLPDQAARMRGIAAGSIDIAMQVGAGDIEELKSLGGQALMRLGTRVTYLSFVTEEAVNKNSPIQHQKVRQAINYAVDREKITTLLLEGIAQPSAQLVLPGAPGHVADLKPFPYDPGKAKQLLKEAGYPNGIKITARASVVGADQSSLYQQVEQDMRAAGIQLTVQPTAVAEMTRIMFEGNFGTDLFTNISRGLDALGDYRYRSCLGLTGNYKPYFCDPVALEFVKQAQNATDPAEADKLVQQATRREYENPPGVFLWQESFVDGAGPKVVSAPDYGSYYDFLPLHLISVKK
jgi:peptide/nickel transport system substrate-binding protein